MKENLNNKNEILINQIREAFSNVTLENGIGLNETQGIDDYEDAKTQKKLRAIDEKMHWENIPSSELERCNSSLSFFDPKGMRFHLPSFMIAELKGEFSGLTLTLCLDSPNQLKQFSTLTSEQKEVVISFLKHLQQDDSYKYEKKRIDFGLNNIWL